MPEKATSDAVRPESGHTVPPTSLSMVNLQQNAQRVGFLLKHEKGFFKSLFGRSWKRKYCILSGYHFYFFKNKKGAGKDGSNGVINLRYFDQCTLPTEKQCSLPHVIRLSSSQKSDNYSFLFQADSLDEMQRWMTDIQLVIYQCQTQGRNSAGPQAASRAGSQPGSPLANRQMDPAVHDHSTRHSSIPEPGSVGVYRTTSSGDEGESGDYVNEHEPVSRSESRNAKPVEHLVPRMPKYNQVVSELQLKLHRPDHPSDTTPPSPHKPTSRHPSTLPTSSPRPDSSTSSSASSYRPHTPPAVIEPPAQFRLPPLPTTPLKSPNLDAQFDSVLKMMENMEDDEQRSAEYAIPYKDKHRPAVPPKPKRELYESLLHNHVTLQDVEKMYLMACKALIRAENAREMYEGMAQETRIKQRHNYANIRDFYC